MNESSEIAVRLQHFANHIERWRTEAARLTLLVSAARRDKAAVGELIALEETAGEIYRDITAFQATVAEIARQSPEAASQLAPVSDALHLVLLEITELGIDAYRTHSGLPALDGARE